MSDLIGFRRNRPMISYPRSYILTEDDYPFYSSDEETLPAIVNTHSIRPRNQPMVESLSSPYLPSTSYRTMIENEPLVYQRIHSPIYTDHRSYQTPMEHMSPSPPKRNIRLPKHAKKLVNRFLDNLEHAHGHQHRDGNDSDSSLDDCDVCRRLRSAMNEEKAKHNSRIIIEKKNSSAHTHCKHCNVCHLLEQSHIGTSNKSQPDKHVHIIGTYPPNPPPPPPPPPIVQPAYYPPAYNTYIDPNTGLTYTYDPNWQYNPYSSYMPNNVQTLPPTMDKATYTRMATGSEVDRSNEKTIVIHSARDPASISPKVVLEEPRRHHRRSRRHRSKTLVTERATRVPHYKSSSYI